MEKQEIIQAFCEIQRTAHEHIGFDTAADCFCHRSLPDDKTIGTFSYQNQGFALEFIREAVAEKIARES